MVRRGWRTGERHARAEDEDDDEESARCAEAVCRGRDENAGQSKAGGNTRFESGGGTGEVVGRALVQRAHLHDGDDAARVEPAHETAEAEEEERHGARDEAHHHEGSENGRGGQLVERAVEGGVRELLCVQGLEASRPSRAESREEPGAPS